MTTAQMKSLLTSRESLRTILLLLVLVVAVFGVGLLALRHENLQISALEKKTGENTVPAVQNAYTNMQITGDAAIVYDLTNGTVLFSQNAEKQLPLASLTKLLTVYGATKVLTPNTEITISSEALGEEGDFGLSEGEAFTFADLARFTLVSSSNDGAEAINESAKGSLGVSTKQMLASVASAVGLIHTQALNSTGLDENTTKAGAYGSAHDIALLSAALLKTAPELALATTERSVTIVSKGGVTHTLKNTNQDVTLTPGILLSKTGYTDLAGGNLVVIFDAGISHPIAVVVLGSTKEGRFVDVEKLISATLSQFAGLPAV